VRHDLLEAGIGERVELQLHDRPQPRHRHADREADDPGLGERGIEAPLVAVGREQAVGDAEDAAEPPDVLAEHHDALVIGHGVAQRSVQRLGHRGGAHSAASSSASTMSRCSRSVLGTSA
jgi:hypothetical protein